MARFKMTIIFEVHEDSKESGDAINAERMQVAFIEDLDKAMGLNPDNAYEFPMTYEIVSCEKLQEE